MAYQGTITENGIKHSVTFLESSAQQIDDAVAVSQSAAQIPKPNLLHNWCFTNPTNQRRKTQYSASGHFIDRWVMSGSSGISAVLTADGIQITNESAATMYIRQPISPSLPAGEYTLTSLVKSLTGTASMYLVYDSANSFSPTVPLAAGLNTTTVLAADTVRRVQFNINAGSSITIAAAKLEKGAMQTLAFEGANSEWTLTETPEKSIEAAKCAQYFERIQAGATNLTLAFGTASATILYVPLKIAPKRAAAAAFTAAEIANLRYGTTSLGSTPTAASVYSADWENGFVTLAVTGTFTAGAGYRLGIIANGYLDFNADIT